MKNGFEAQASVQPRRSAESVTISVRNLDHAELKNCGAFVGSPPHSFTIKSAMKR